ncbi:hypothetical protein ABE073_04785 [Lederbergia citrisecunda]|uniref:hypothetical protein n=1 Tax=Lederbergia citrisecunda TaxID=2833583 RepID=UPI003D27ED82
MAQVSFKNEEFHGVLHFNVGTMEYDENLQLDLIVNDFDDFTKHMHNFYKRNFGQLFKNITVHTIEFTGISFTGRQGTELFSVDITDGWKRATIIFDEKKFGDISIDKIRRIKKIIEE